MVADENLMEALERIESLLRVLASDRIEEVMTELKSNPHYRSILEHLSENGETQATVLKESMAKVLSVSTRTAQDRIQEMVAKGVVKVRRAGKRNFYFINPLFG